MQQLTFQAPDLNTTTLGEAGVTTVFKLVDGSYEGSDEIPFKQLNVDTIIEFELPAGTGGSCGLDLNFDKVCAIWTRPYHNFSVYVQTKLISLRATN